MTPLEKAVEAITAYHGGDVHEDDKEHARIAIRAFLEAAAEDVKTLLLIAGRVAEAPEQTGFDRKIGVILGALKETLG